jgi:hypothetical protein
MKNSSENSDMREEYDFSKSVPNKYASVLRKQENFVRIDPDIFKIFNTEEKVNKALRSIIEALPGDTRFQYNNQ